MESPILKVKNLKTHFPVYKGLFFKKVCNHLKAVDGISFSLAKGKTLGLVGESGCGKSTVARSIMQLTRVSEGDVWLENKDITELVGSERLSYKKKIQMIFQDPYASLNPRMTVFDIIKEPIVTHGLHKDRRDLEKRISELMEKVGLSPRYIKKYPHEFSGGQRQRIAIARALAIEPKVIICDEPTSALDVSIQAQILNLLKQLQKELELSYIFIAHDLATVKYISDEVAVMYLGKIVEHGPVANIFANPTHPYTKYLLNAIPAPDPRQERQRKRELIAGEIPSPLNVPKGCRFHPRCPLATDLCREKDPGKTDVTEEHISYCHMVTAS